MLPSVLTKVVIGTMLPLGAELDFGPLPPKGANAPPYDFQIVIETVGKSILVPVEVGRDVEPDFSSKGVADSLKNEGWTVRREGLSVVVMGFGDSPIRKVEVKGNGPKPRFRWVARPK